MLGRLHALLRSETVFIAVTAAGGALACALAFARLGFLGLGLVGLVALLVAVRAEMEDGPALGRPTPDLLAAMQRAEDGGDSAALRRQADRTAKRRMLLAVRLGAGALVLVGGLGFVAVQLG